MKVYFLRHGVAVESDQWQGVDAERPLTADGRKAMEREAKVIAQMDLELDAIVTSPLARAKETAAIVGEQLKMKPIDDERLAGGFDASALAQILRRHADAKNVMLVGHEPHFSRTIGALIGSGRVQIKKGGLARVDVKNASLQSGELVWLIPPKALAL
jgi:phosphohistidine phosphatase